MRIALLLVVVGCDALVPLHVATVRASRIARVGTPSMALVAPSILLAGGASFTPAKYVFSLTLPTSSAAVSFSTTAVLAWGLILTQCFADGGLLSGVIEDFCANLREGGKATGTERVQLGYYQLGFQIFYFFLFVTGAARAGDDGFGWEFIGLGSLIELLGLVQIGLA